MKNDLLFLGGCLRNLIHVIDLMMSLKEKCFTMNVDVDIVVITFFINHTVLVISTLLDTTLNKSSM